MSIAALATATLLLTAPAHAEEAAATAPPPDEPITRYGIGLRMPRYMTVPSWFLDLFTAENVPLSTFKSYGGEFFARRGDYDIVVGVTYQNMSPEDGNWLGKGKLPREDTDFVQVRDIALLGADVSFVYRFTFTDYVGVRFGAGLGLAKVLGEVLRISNWSNCTAENAGDERACRPKICPESGCTERMLKDSEGLDGGPDDPKRFREDGVPGAFPIVNLNAGVDFRLPELPGFEARIEGGFYDAFFLGLGLAYVF